MGIVEKIQEIEREMARTQKNKATEYHLGLLKVGFNCRIVPSVCIDLMNHIVISDVYFTGKIGKIEAAAA